MSSQCCKYEKISLFIINAVVFTQLHKLDRIDVNEIKILFQAVFNYLHFVVVYKMVSYRFIHRDYINGILQVLQLSVQCNITE